MCKKEKKKKSFTGCIRTDIIDPELQYYCESINISQRGGRSEVRGHRLTTTREDVVPSRCLATSSGGTEKLQGGLVEGSFHIRCYFGFEVDTK